MVLHVYRRRLVGDWQGATLHVGNMPWVGEDPGQGADREHGDQEMGQDGVGPPETAGHLLPRLEAIRFLKCQTSQQLDLV